MNPCQLLVEYMSLKRNMGESVHDYTTRFNNIYNALPPHMKPPQGMALAKYPDGFDADMAYELRDKEYTTLEDMQKGAVNIEANLIEKRVKLRSEKRVTYRDDNVASTSDPNNERMCKDVEKMKQMMEKMVVTVSNLSKN